MTCYYYIVECKHFNIHRQLSDRKKLDAYLSSALGVPLKDGRLQDIDEAKYVLTLDYTVKVCMGYLYLYWFRMLLIRRC